MRSALRIAPFSALATVFVAGALRAAEPGGADAAPPAASKDSDRRPNIVVFLADDLGWGDLGVQGHPRIQTPHLDRFATEGMRFTQGYAASGVCSPARAAILTGRTPYRNGVWRWIPKVSEVHLRESEITLPEALRAAGYQTLHSGKWHLSNHFADPQYPQPGDHGFDHWFSTLNNAAPNHMNPENFVRNGEPVGRMEGDSAHLVAAEAITWLREKRDPARPFLLCVWTHEPHLPIETAPRHQEPYAALDDPDLRQHHGNITQLDAAFGELMSELDAQGLREDTLVFFTSDNGPEGEREEGTGEIGHRKNRARGSTGGLRGRKRWNHEGGIRVPFMARWPGRIAAGGTSAVPIIGSDIFTTALAAAGVAAPERTLDGADIAPAFAGAALKRPVPLFWMAGAPGVPKDSWAALRIGDWKIVGDRSLMQWALFNIVEDPAETRDLAAERPEKLAELRAAFDRTWAGIQAEGPRAWWESDLQRKGPGKGKGKKRGGKKKRGPQK